MNGEMVENPTLDALHGARIAKESNMGEKILTILLELWAEQNGLEIQELIITEREEAS